MATEREDIILNVVVDQAQSKNRLAEISKELKEISTNQKQLNKDLQAGKITQEQYAAAVTQNELATKKLRSEKNVLQRVVTAEKGSLDELKAAYIRLNAEINKTPAGQKVFGKSLDAARKEAAKLKEEINKAQQSVGNFSGNVGNYKSAFDGLGGSLSKIGATLGIAFSASTAIDFFKSAAEGADVEAKSQQRLLVALDGRVEVQERLIRQAEELQKTRLFADDVTVAAQAELATLKLDADQIEQIIPLVQDLATAKGVDLVTASSKVGKAIKGNADSLKKDFGISVKGAKTEAERFAIVQKALNETVGGQAEAAARTGAGAYDLLNLKIGDLKDKVGEAINNFKQLLGLVTTQGTIGDFLDTFFSGSAGLGNYAETVANLFGKQTQEDYRTLTNLTKDELESEKKRSEFRRANLKKEREELVKNNKIREGRTVFGLEAVTPKSDVVGQIDKELAEQEDRLNRINGKLTQFNKNTNQLSDDVKKNAGEEKQALEELLRLRNEAALAAAGGEGTEAGLKILEKQAEAELQKRLDLAKKAKGQAALTEKEIGDLRNQIQQEYADKRIELQKAADEKQREEDEKALEAALKIIDQGYRKRLELDREALLKGEITREEFDNRAKQRELERIEEEIKFRQALGISVIELEQQLSDKRFEIADNEYKKRAELQKTLAEEQKKVYEGLLEATLQFSNTLGQIFIKDGEAAQRFNNTINALQNTFQAFFKIQQALDAYEQARSKARVAQDLTEASAAGAKGAAKQSGLPFPQNIIAITTTIAAILAALSTIGGAFKKFEAGGLLDGPSHKGGGIKGMTRTGMPFEAEGGEYIVNKKATANNLPAIAAINKYGKNTSFDVVPRFEAGGALYDGGFAARSVSAPVLDSIQNNNLINALSRIKFAVSVTDIETGLAGRASVVSNSSIT